MHGPTSERPSFGLKFNFSKSRRTAFKFVSINIHKHGHSLGFCGGLHPVVGVFVPQLRKLQNSFVLLTVKLNSYDTIFTDLSFCFFVDNAYGHAVKLKTMLLFVLVTSSLPVAMTACVFPEYNIQ